MCNFFRVFFQTILIPPTGKLYNILLSMKARLFSLWLLLSVAVGLSAYDFKVDGLCYDITSSTTSYAVEVTYEQYPNGGYRPAYQSLTTANIPKSVTYQNQRYSVTSIGRNAFRGCTGLTSVTIPNSVTSIESWAFSGCTGLTSVTIPNSVTSIGESSFNGCISLTSVTIGNSVTSIGSSAFSGCTGLTSVTIPNSVTSIGESSFNGCTSLTSVTIGNSVTSIGSSAFYGCTSLTSVVWNAKNCNDFSKEETPFHRWYYSFDVRSQITSFVFGDSVQHIPDYLCEGMENLTSITIGNSVTSIGNSAFSGCTGIASVIIPNSVTSIGSSAFSSCTSITSITIPNSVTSIGSSAFNSCTSITSITIPNGVTSIENSAFSDCTGLTSVVIGNGVTNIGGNVFKGCKNVETVVFGSAVETIGASAFAGCQSIYEMTIYATKVPTIQENTFTEVGTGATLRVPAGCAKKYKAHPYWGVFNIEEIPSEYTVTVTCDPQYGQVSGGGTYKDGSEVTITATANTGYAFTQWSDGNKDNPRKVTVTADVTYTAEFALQTYVVSATCDPQQGQVTGGGTYPYGSEVTLTAVPNEGYAFTQWSDGNKDNPRKVTVTADATYTAEFALQTYVVSVTCDPQQGQVTGGGTYPYGSEVTLTAVPSEGYAFTQWSDGNKDNPRKVTVTADATYTAEFALQIYVVSVTCDPQQGQVTGGGTYPYGSEVTLTATPNKGYEFTQWSDGNKDNPRKVTVTADATYTAEFALQTYVVSVTCDSQQGQVTGGGTYPYGSEVTLTATPNNGYEFKQWSDGSIANPYSFSVEKDVTIEALFEPTTPVENVAAEENDTPRKVFRNGQVLILRNGKTYTLTGEEVK